MTDYILHKKNDNNKKDSEKKGHKRFLIVFLALVFIFVSVNIVCKSFGAVKGVSNSSWDGKSSLPVFMGKYIFVYQQDPKRIAILNSENNQLSDIEGSKKLSRMLGVPLNYYLNLKNESLDNVKNIEDRWKDFTSYLTPIKIITGIGLGNMNTNISRFDAIKLWWQAKSIGVNKLEMVDLGSMEISGSKKVLGAHLDDLNRIVKEYFENVNIIQEKSDIKIVNSSGVELAGDLAFNFINSVGGEVAGVNSTTDEVKGCRILASNRNYTVSYLAKLFQCDINDAPEGENEGEIMIFVGSDFSKKYFE